jgi:S1-C subfamily serine protease
MIKSIGRVLLAAIAGTLVGLMLVGVVKLSNTRRTPKASAIVYARERVVKIHIFAPMGYGTASGWVLYINNKPFIVTNKHVCADGEMFVQPSSSNIMYHAQKVRASTMTDLCLIVPEQDFPAVGGFQIAKRSAATNDILHVTGHPFGSPLGDFDCHFMEYGTAPASLDSLRVGLLDRIIFPGNSGSPVLNDANEVVGVIFAYMRNPHKQTEGVGAFIPREELLRFLTFNEGPTR